MSGYLEVTGGVLSALLLYEVIKHNYKKFKYWIANV